MGWAAWDVGIRPRCTQVGPEHPSLPKKEEEKTTLHVINHNGNQIMNFLYIALMFTISFNCQPSFQAKGQIHYIEKTENNPFIILSVPSD